MGIAQLLRPLMWPLFIAAFVAISALRQRTRLRTVVATAVIAYSFFVALQLAAVLGFAATLSAFGDPGINWLTVAGYLVAGAAIVALGVAVGWWIRARVIAPT